MTVTASPGPGATVVKNVSAAWPGSILHGVTVMPVGTSDDKESSNFRSRPGYIRKNSDWAF